MQPCSGVGIMRGQLTYIHNKELQCLPTHMHTHASTHIKCFTRSLSPDLKVVQCGIVVAECGFLGASPDAVVENSSREEVCVIEVKCPYSARESTVVEACSTSFFCELVGRRPTLKEIMTTTIKYRDRWQSQTSRFVTLLYGHPQT